ncbi:Subtilisin DY, partial [Colletotrichum shisoi]
MFLSMKKEWHEAWVHMAKKSVVRLGDGAAQLQRKIIRPKVQPSKVKSLCEPITKIVTMRAYGLELKVMREKLFILKPEKNPPPMGGDYKSFRFFDDEAIPEAVTGEARYRYEKWKSDYTAVYDKFIPGELDITPVRVAVLDTGIDITHPDVEARVGNVKGTYNSLTDRHQSKFHDRNAHGTFTACLILDYAPDAELYAAKIAEKDPSNPSVIAKAINWAVTEWKVDIISMSFGFPDRDIEGYVELENALQNAYANNVVLFAAASNSGGKLGRSFPAREPEVIAVHATDANGNRSHFSQTATDYDINLATVGEAVESAWPV